ncbi:MAG: asparagine synthase (glutamine-hydrolyzing) [Limisphaerales bacterium]
MCGIAGFFTSSPKVKREDLDQALARMCESIQHRGPDDSGTWVDEMEGIALGHRRLSILDLSPAGHQPMQSACGRNVIVFNGEIYNFMELRKELEDLGHVFGGHSDTEIMLAAIGQWGVEASLKRFVGMFAFVLWDRKERVLVLARDRMGEKPLYYGWCKSTFLFASELKALRAHPVWDGQIDRGVLALYLKRGYVPAPFSIYQNIFKLIPGTFLSLATSHARPRRLFEPKPYWSFHDAAEAGLRCPFSGSESEASGELDRLLRSAVSQQMVADVPLGAFLSGGVDSSTVVALMQTQSKQPIRTFTIGFQEAGFNEAEYAKAVARHLGTEHTEMYVTGREAMAVIPKLPFIYDEPFSDASQIPTFLVSKLARQQVTVSLSGDAGDELFYGYSRYSETVRIWNTIESLPLSGRTILNKVLTSIPIRGWDAILDGIPSFAKPKRLQNCRGDSIQRLADKLLMEKRTDLYSTTMFFWQESGLVLGDERPLRAFADRQPGVPQFSFEHEMMWRDSVDYLPDDILVKVDRASMAVSLESRIPLLDYRVVEFALSVPLSMKARDRQSKWLLRQVLHKYVPRKLIERPKKGFAVPIGEWLRGPLLDWAETLLAEKRLVAEGWFNPKPIREKWMQHRAGTRNWQHQLWVILMFQAWQEQEKQAPSESSNSVGDRE